MTFNTFCIEHVFPKIQQMHIFDKVISPDTPLNTENDRLLALRKFLKGTLSAAHVRNAPWTELLAPSAPQTLKKKLVEAQNIIAQEKEIYFDPDTIEERVYAIQDFCEKNHAQIFLIPKNDPFQNEYSPDCYNYLHFMTGFSGSAGFSLITPQQAYLFVDGRYTLQAKEEAHPIFEQENYTLKNIIDVIAENTEDEDVVLFDPWLHSAHQIEMLQEKLSHLIFKPLDHNPIAALWSNRPEMPISPIVMQTIDYTGESFEEKVHLIQETLEKYYTKGYIITAPDEIAWLANIRGFDIPYSPVSLCFAIFNNDGTLHIFVNPCKIPYNSELLKHKDIKLYPFEHFEKHLNHFSHEKVLVDPKKTAFFVIDTLEKNNAHVVYTKSPISHFKAAKNTVELEGMRQAHIRDGAKIATFLYTLPQQVQTKGMTEQSAADLLHDIRCQDPLFLMPSFSTISASGPHAALCHYKVTEETNRPLQDAVYLVDSGGQYPDGTTDITRTIALQPVSDDIKKHFTLVLKGHIAIAKSVFPKGTTGAHLDALARQYLWQHGLDYAHGTGHGVGAFLNVHEGPQSISKHMIDVPLEVGMILSNEPGYYKEDEYGIRIENLVIVTPSPYDEFYMFETITFAPIDLNMIDTDWMTDEEINWLNLYHQEVYEKISPHVTPDVKTWLQQATAPIDF